MLVDEVTDMFEKIKRMETEKEGSNEEKEVKEMKVQNKDKSKQVILEAYKQHCKIQEMWRTYGE